MYDITKEHRVLGIPNNEQPCTASRIGKEGERAPDDTE